MREFSIITSNNHPSNPQQPPATHPLRLAPVRWIWIASGKGLHNGKIHHAINGDSSTIWAMASMAVDITRPGSLWRLNSWPLEDQPFFFRGNSTSKADLSQGLCEFTGDVLAIDSILMEVSWNGVPQFFSKMRSFWYWNPWFGATSILGNLRINECQSIVTHMKYQLDH